MKKIRIILGMASGLVIAGLTGCGEPEPEVDLVYQKRLDYIVYNHEFRDYGTKANRDDFLSKPPSWTLLLKIPETPIIEVWDAKHDQPQVMFTYGRDATVYTMNLNGTDVRQLLHRDELGELPYRGFTQRSPNGRYLALNYYASVAQSCAVYDLKMREVVAKVDSCFSATFTQDSEQFYFTESRQVQKIDLETRKKSYVFDGPIHVGNEVFYPKRHQRGFALDEKNDRFIWTVSPKDNRGEVIQIAQLVFKLSDMSLIGKQSYLSEDCQTGFGRNPVSNYFVCSNKGKNRVKGVSHKYNDIYSFIDPSKVVEEAPYEMRVILQKQKWYAERFGHALLRFRQQDEPGMFDRLKYHYVFITADRSSGYYQLNKLNYFIPPKIAKDFANYDLRPFFPTIPTQEQYDESLQRQLKEREKKLTGKRNKS
ncbi:hypothetical protein QWZ04_12245 [Vibrio tapetis subsp. quintayensis]|uniref:hypothetical protein n=1 Tax=Vibrio tapetis TaxID=52443 RepID=UPI0025B3DFDF|nr:hypothetical protein [Vibrio tapetis]MDN3681093.1 hypothetical protein [Vibrio tapetis subsp. quintayensis]